ncbi:MAG: hypothetical protein WA906_12680, partial [Pacificimonas sp.]
VRAGVPVWLTVISGSVTDGKRTIGAGDCGYLAAAETLQFSFNSQILAAYSESAVRTDLLA